MAAPGRAAREVYDDTCGSGDTWCPGEDLGDVGDCSFEAAIDIEARDPRGELALDSGFAIAALVTVGLLLAGMPERVVDFESDVPIGPREVESNPVFAVVDHDRVLCRRPRKVL